jgi:hypothetical protein
MKRTSYHTITNGKKPDSGNLSVKQYLIPTYIAKLVRATLSLILFLSLIWSCSYLDYTEADNYEKNQVFEEFSWNKLAMTRIYAYLPTDFSSVDGAMRSSAIDDAEHIYDNSVIQKFNDGTWNSLQTVDDQWATFYAGIRAANLYLEEGTGRTFDELKWNADYKELMVQYALYPYEARFLRAFFYFELIRRYGDVPLIIKVLTEEEANKVTRTPFADVVQFIVSECDAIIPNLPRSFTSIPGAETGRATRGAAMALKARTLLYAASPLFNPTNDKTKWIAAATASKALIDSATVLNYALDASYANVVNSLTTKELIFERRQAAANSFEAANFPIGYEGGNTGTCPTQNLVDAYEMQAKGLGINEPGSGYDPAKPYSGRDPRLALTILYDGATWKGVPVEIWNGGKNAPPIRYATKTGYYLKKYLIEAVSLSPTSPSTRIHTWVLFRYGEVLLNYAEAMNEAYGPEITGSGNLSTSALAAVNLVRTRVKMPAFPAGLSQNAFRTKLMNERRIELAFEDHRFWDIRRWKIGGSTTVIQGMDIEKDSQGQMKYTGKIVENRIWNDRMYLYPVSQNELFINQSLTQNPGW